MFKTGLRKTTGKMIAAAAIAGLGGSAANAAVMTYDLRIASATGAGVVQDGKTFTNAANGDVLTLNLYAVLSNSSGTQLDDGMQAAWGSFKSTGSATTVQGTLRGDAAGSPSTQNNVAPFNGGTSVSGLKTDLDGDGDLDVGNNQTAGTISPANSFFQATTNGATIFGTNATAGSPEFLIGTTTFTVTDASQINPTSLNFIPRLNTSGGVSGPRIHKFSIDGVTYAVDANGNGAASVGTNTTATTGTLVVGSAIVVSPPVAAPEPATLGLLGVAAAALLRRRK